MRCPIILAVFAVICAVSAPGYACEEGGLLFTCRKNEQSDQSFNHDPPLAALDEVRRNEVQYVVPEVTVNPSFDFVSWQYITKLGFNMLVGARTDLGHNEYVYDPDIFRRVDALLYPRRYEKNEERIDPIHLRQLFFSPQVGTTIPSGDHPPALHNYIRPGDVARLIQEHTYNEVLFEHFISREHIETAFNIDPNANVNVDAIALHYAPYDPEWPMANQGVYLSFEGNTTIDIDGYPPMNVQDGAILRIPGDCIIYIPSDYDDPPAPYGGPSVLVGAVTQAGCGQIILKEPEVDALVDHAEVRGNSGNLLNTIIDVDGLTLPQSAVGYFTSQWTPGPIHHLWFSGFRLTGAGILSTEGGGTIPGLNGVPMANNNPGPPVSTTGEQVGLEPPEVSSLNGLALTPGKDLPHLVTDSPTPVLTAAASHAYVQVGGGDLPTLPVPPTGFIGLNFSDPVIDLGSMYESLGMPWVRIPGTFPELFAPHSALLWPYLWGTIVIDPVDGCDEWDCDYAPVYPFLVGGALYAQVYLFSDTEIALSSPLKIKFDP